MDVASKSLYIKVGNASCQLPSIRQIAAVPFSGSCHISRESKWFAVDCLFVWDNVASRERRFMRCSTENSVCVREE